MVEKHSRVDPLSKAIGLVDTSNKWGNMSKENRDAAIAFLEGKGHTLFCPSQLEFDCKIRMNPYEVRAANFREVIANEEVGLALALQGGSDSIGVVEELDQNGDLDRLAKRGLPFNGFSDSTAVANGIYHRTGVATFVGPSLANFGDPEVETTYRYFRQMISEGYVELTESSLPKQFVEDPGEAIGAKDSDVIRQVFPPWEVIQGKAGDEAVGKVVGGNILTFGNMFSEYQPSIEGAIFIGENSGAVDDVTIRSTLDRLIRAGRPKAILLGTFQKESFKHRSKFVDLIRAMRSLHPSTLVMIGLPFGHIAPRMTIPIGGQARIRFGQGGYIGLELATGSL